MNLSAKVVRISCVIARWRCATRQGLLRFAACNRAIAAVEFALILPVLLVLFLGTFEITRAIEINRKVNNAANIVADLVTQSDQATVFSALDDIFQAADVMLSPYESAPLGIVLSAVRLNSDNNPEVVWSVECKSTLLTTGTQPPATYSALSTLYDSDVDLVVAVATYNHSGIFSRMFGLGDLIFDFEEFAPYRPRTFDQYSTTPSQTSFCL